jgi:hypothetical protein
MTKGRHLPLQAPRCRRRTYPDEHLHTGGDAERDGGAAYEGERQLGQARVVHVMNPQPEAEDAGADHGRYNQLVANEPGAGDGGIIIDTMPAARRKMM